MALSLDAGFYINLFKVDFTREEIEIMAVDRSAYPSLKELRNEIEQEKKDIYIYAPEKSKKVYGFGKDMKWLSTKGFKSENIKFYEEPRLTSFMIFEGLKNKALDLDYSPQTDKDKGRLKLFDQKNFKQTSDLNVKVFQGYDIRVIFLRDEDERKLVFCLVIDVVYSLKDREDKPLNFREVVKKFGSSTLKEVRQIQRDLLPNSKINSEASRQRLLEDILPFVEKLSESEINLSCGVSVRLNTIPVRVTIGEEQENETIW